METPQSESLNKRDILAKFGDRVLWHPEEVKKEYLGLDENLTKRDLVGSDIADKYEQAQISDQDTFDHFGTIRGKILSCSLLKKGFNPIGLSIFKNMRDGESWYALGINKGNPINKDPKKVYERFLNREKRIGDFYLYTKKDGNFYIPDRYVWPQYRGKQNKGGERISNVLLKACEQIIQCHANKENKSKILEVNTAQIDVMMWLNANGYEPKTDQDKQRFERVINADNHLIIVEDYHVFEKDKLEEGVDLHDQKNESVRITFEKKFEPNPNTMAENIRGQVAAV
jgi:hypothetical protein